MDKNEKKHLNNPRRTANPLSAITFTWLFDIFRTGYKRELEISDLYSPLDEHTSSLLGQKISKLWESEEKRCQKSTKKKSSPSLLRVIVKCFGCELMVYGFILGLFEFLVKTTQPIILANLLKYFSGKVGVDRTQAYYWASGIVLGVALSCIINHPVYQGLMHMGMKIRVACCSLIYRKILRISKSAIEGDTSVGQMVNLLSNDVNRLDYSVFSLHYIWITMIQTALVSYLLYREVNLAAVGGVFTMLLFIPVHGCYGKLSSYFTLKFSFKTDERLRLTNEIISGVKVIKMYAWEKPFSFLVDKAREKEVKVIRNNLMMSEICWSFESYIPRVCLFVTILAYILFGNTIDAEKVYLVTAYYNVLRTSLYRMFPLGIKECAEAFVSVKRLQKFLVSDEVQANASNISYVSAEANDGVAVSLKNVTAKWKADAKHEALSHVNLDVKLGSLTAIVGQVGSGKTTLLHALLNEMPHVEGDIKIAGKMSYASQEAWIFASTVRQNITFSLPFNKERYDKVIEVCQLKRDLELLPYGDSTLVGERGINLSGGQCARVNLARAIYQEADIYLLDDPLSAVDSHVGRGIFEKCIKSFLKGKTVVLVTHQFHYLKNVDHIVILGDGEIQAQGSATELLDSALDLAKMIRKENDKGSDAVDDVIDPPVNKENGTAKPAAAAAAVAAKSEEEEDEEEESRTRGNITAKTYLQYFGAAKNVFLVLMVYVVSIMCQVMSSGADYFISYWVNYEEKEANNTLSAVEGDPLQGRGWFIYVLGSMTIGTMVLTLLQAYIFFDMCMRISRNLHAALFDSICHTSMAFFNANPIGRILNRFSKDMGIVDTRVPQTIIDVTQISLYTIAVLGIIASVNPWFLLPAAALGTLAYFFRTFYMSGSRSIKRLEGITRSPVFNHLSASIQGISTIRALRAQEVLTKEFDSHQDLHSSAWFLFFSGSRAFGFYIESIYLIFTASVVFTLVAVNDVALAGSAGLVITQCILLTGMLQWGVRQTAELENQMTSVERVLEYTKLPQEPALESSENKPPEKWPASGRIEFNDVTLTYGSQKKAALRHLTFCVEPNEMVGIVGRTGAGKSSLLNALFRLADLEGEIKIDGLDTSKISLRDLRSKISIIPQEPVLFGGTLRTNLDPFEEYADNELWRALEDVELKGTLDSDLGLEMRVMEGGTNFSVGQRQLLCLARAIVRNNKILVLDEATANVDPRTDELIQKAIRRKFANCTVLIIAHRLNTVMDSTKIIVMDAGRVVEFDHPYKLLQRNDGVLYGMVQQTGAGTAENLLQIAKSSYESKNSSEDLEQ
ncbi:probable multidrug resistance-associated protein lethal(2)03659 [Trichogramma pretiosum]|uniref:probable multidrug resistance-associated protein lethal(2)03659 n=1 Tax=Trichogramma pretiosum TaxID=7493 RepID=UPI0006C99EDE|nr:probable multidrug resistance-associated protein lethal(2)03659 [Trichogramma pretiosum]XP_014227214.1 probable multidrug resistance-associated protein lethal(2)03659 [Trichogramma pretiosum]XP_014227215.1 probable multidrug resistance-associated protein lethal(2)03659 [Trichogramma pretiosum]